MLPRLLAGPPLAAGPESLAGHGSRLGPLPPATDRRTIIDVIAASGLLGRGGAGFPVARKWAAVAERGAGAAVVLANGAEGEPLSAKDRTLMATRPHLVLDGAVLAADAVGADRIILYVGSEHGAARSALATALAERAAAPTTEASLPISLVTAPPTYVAGEESAAVHYVNDGDGRPAGASPRPFERGVSGRPTLVQNVESLAHAALIARHGDAWYRELGGAPTPGSALVTVGTAAGRGVTEIAIGTTVAELAAVARVPNDARAVLLGGYFGGWLSADEAWDLPLDPVSMRAAGSAFGCGVVSFLDRRECGVETTARIIDYMAGQSAAQCGPCVFGLRAIADATARIAAGSAHADDLVRVTRWSAQLAGRGACRHPDGAVGLMHSALRVFADEFAAHERTRACPAARFAERAA
jgi:NADH:ubiquinone oxidoreductase subunit F (NADH-binding)